MIAAPELLGLLDDNDVLGPLDHAHDGGIAAQIATDGALLRIGDVEASDAEANLGPHREDRLREPTGILVLDAEDVEGQTLGALAADSRQVAPTRR